MQMIQQSNEFAENSKEDFPHIKCFKSPSKKESNIKQIHNQMCTVRGKMLLAEGEKKWNEAVFIEENFNMDLVYDALDAGNMAGKTAFCFDLELEAISEAFLGKIHYKGLKNYKKAKEHFLNCIRLAHKMTPKVVTNLDWYKLCEKQL